MRVFADKKQGGRRGLVWFVCGSAGGVLCGINTLLITEIEFKELLMYSLIFSVTCAAVLLIISLCARGTNAGGFVLIWVTAFGFIVGVLHVSAYDSFRYTELKRTAGVKNRYTAVLTEDPMPTSVGKAVSFKVRVLGYDTENGFEEAKGYTLLYSDENICDYMRTEDVISFDASLEKPEDKSFDGGFSKRENLYRNGAVFSAFANNIKLEEDIKPPDGIVYTVNRMGRKIQKSIITRVEMLFGGTNDETALLKGLMIGNRDDLNDIRYGKFQGSGFVHIIAVSGMHVMFFCNALSFAVRRLRIPRRIARVLPIPLLILLASAASFTPSVSRAVIMQFVMIMAVPLKREYDSLTALALAAVIIVAVNPYLLTSYGFVLSFSSVVGIILFSDKVYRLFKMYGSKRSGFALRVSDALKQSASVSVGAQTGLIYFSARFFGYASWGSIIGNVFVIPLASGAYIGGIFVWILSFAAPRVATVIARYPLRFVLWLINRFADIFSLGIFGINLPTLPKSAFVVFAAVLYLLYKILELRIKSVRSG